MIEGPNAPGYVFLRADQLHKAVIAMQLGYCPRFRLMYRDKREISVSAADIEKHKEHSIVVDAKFAALLKAGTIAELKHESFGDMLVRVVGKRDGNNLVEDMEGRVKLVARPWLLRPISFAES